MAQHLFERALVIDERALGADHPSESQKVWPIATEVQGKDAFGFRMIACSAKRQIPPKPPTNETASLILSAVCAQANRKRRRTAKVLCAPGRKAESCLGQKK